ncbi:hypothetical protein GIB67_015021 [Kingdonia uniflora]|uniref:Uncharacterized protein n=1 Tax=Kingdonia uniflora TaxID=39325 RepID=A0A7J7MTS5_9MAGN|nr:hypothetical protein GIB67_015021 [Kingdonia uniflora]
MPLQVPNGNYEYYLGDRYWRQLTGEAHIPLDPPLSMSPHISPATLQKMSAQELWHLTHGMWQLALAESARDARRLQELTDKNDTLRRHLDSVDDQLYAHDLHLRRGCDVRVVPLPAGGGVRTRQRGSGLRIRGGGVSSSSSDNLIFDCAAAIYVLHQAAMNIVVVYDATSSHGRSVMGRKDKRKKRDHPLGYYSIIQVYFKPNCTYEP